MISNYGVGVDHIDVRAATRKRLIPVGNTPDVLNGAVADQAMALLLAAGMLSAPARQIQSPLHCEWNIYVTIAGIS